MQCAKLGTSTVKPGGASSSCVAGAGLVWGLCEPGGCERKWGRRQLRKHLEVTGCTEFLQGNIGRIYDLGAGKVWEETGPQPAFVMRCCYRADERRQVMM
eukprot:1159755-Pelagomonas_calceolata.AAC.9